MHPSEPPAGEAAVAFKVMSFDAVPHWVADDHAAAFRAFLKSAARLLDRAQNGDAGKAPPAPRALLAACDAALGLGEAGAGAAKAFFEDRFTPHRVEHDGREGLLTGYYEPRLRASRVSSDAYPVPIHRRPPDLVNMVDETERGAKAGRPTHMRKTASGLEPYFTRAQIEEGALRDRGLEMLHFADPVDVFFMHVQGSGLAALDDGTEVRVTYDGKNGYGYTSIGRYVLDRKLMTPAEMSLEGLQAFLRADPDRARRVMRQNQSYVFFREMNGADAPIGSFEIPLSPGRSLAVDTRHHAIGAPVYVAAPALTHAGGADGFHRLMIAQDVGSAIVGPERGDIFFGSGEEGWRLASVTQHPGAFIVLLPKDAA